MLQQHNFRQKKKYEKRIESRCMTFNLTHKIRKVLCKALPSSVFKSGAHYWGQFLITATLE